MTVKRRGTRSIAFQMVLAVVLGANGFVVAAVAGEPAAERVELKVTAAGLDLSTAEGAGAFLDRLAIAAKNACGESTELTKRPVYEHCYQQAIADAVRDINQSVLLRAYVARFPSEAVQFGVSAGQVAAK